MKRKLTVSQLNGVQAKAGLFDNKSWRKCLVYLFALLTVSDPPDPEEWTSTHQLLRNFTDWAIQTAHVRFGASAASCLKHASDQDMGVELEHQRSNEPCVFSGRTTPLKHAGVVTSLRVQCDFIWWAHHQETGLACPHWSDPFVYEAQFSFLVKGVYLVGHFSELMRHLSKSNSLPSLTQEQFLQSGVWTDAYEKLNCAMYVIWATLTTRL